MSEIISEKFVSSGEDFLLKRGLMILIFLSIVVSIIVGYILNAFLQITIFKILPLIIIPKIIYLILLIVSRFYYITSIEERKLMIHNSNKDLTYNSFDIDSIKMTKILLIFWYIEDTEDNRLIVDEKGFLKSIIFLIKRIIERNNRNSDFIIDFKDKNDMSKEIMIQNITR